MDVLTKIKGLSYLGWGTLGRSFLYGFRRDAWNRRFQKGRRQGEQGVGALVEAIPTADGGRFGFEHATLEVRFLAKDLVRMTWEPGALPVPYAIAREDWEPVETSWSRVPGQARMAAGDLEVLVNQDGSVTVEAPGQGTLRWDGPPIRSGEGWRLSGELATDEAVHGLGFRTGGLDLRGRSWEFWNSEPKGAYAEGDDPLYVCLPVLVTRRGPRCALTFFENSHRGRISLAHDRQEVRFEGGALRYYVIPGPIPRAMERFTELTGRPAMPPRWALGFHQARWSYMNEEEVRELARKFREHDLPWSAVHLDIHYMQGHRVFTVDPDRFPDLKALCRDLETEGVRLVTILDPGVKAEPGFHVYDSGMARGAFCTLPDGRPALAEVWPGTCVFPDFTDPETRRWWGDFYPRLLDQGVAGVWHDMNEPAAFAAWGSCTLPLPVRHAMEGRGGDHLEAHNLYGFLEDRAAYEAMRRLRPDRRPWILSRSGWVGLARYAWHWTGDSESNWWTLRQTLRIVMNLGLSGIPWTGSDIGGFGGHPDPELFVRWFQAQAFLPFFRVHSAFFTPRREPWCFGPEVLAIVRGLLRERYRLLPYWYTLAATAHRQGHPPVRPLFWIDPEDPEVGQVDDAFLVGDALLVAPVLEPGATVRRVRLPRGAFLDLSGDQGILAGGRWHVVAAPLDRVPVFQRCGSVIPLAEEGGTVLQLALPAGDSCPGGSLYQDDGDGYGPFCLERYRVDADAPDEVVLRTDREGDRPPEPLSLRVAGGMVREAQVDGAVLAGPGPFALPAGFREVRLRLVPEAATEAR